MKPFLVLLKNKGLLKLEVPLLLEHVEHLKNIHNSGNLLICGPFIDGTGAVLIIKANSKQEAEKIIQSDPFIKEKYYTEFSITEFQQADNSNNWLADHL